MLFVIPKRACLNRSDKVAQRVTDRESDHVHSGTLTSGAGLFPNSQLREIACHLFSSPATLAIKASQRRGTAATVKSFAIRPAVVRLFLIRRNMNVLLWNVELPCGGLRKTVSLVFRGLFYRDKRHLLQVREVPFRIGWAVRRWKLLHHRLGGESRLEVLRIDLVERFTIGEVVEINRCGDDLAEIQGGLFQVIQLVPHGLAELYCRCSTIDAAVWPGDKSTLRGTVQRFASEDTGAGSGTWRHVFWTDGSTKAQVAHGHPGVFDVSLVRQSGDFY